MFSRDFLNKRVYASFIGPEITNSRLREFVRAVREHSDKILGIAVNLYQVRLAADLLQETTCMVVAPVAYPQGNLPTEIKVIQIQQARADGAHAVAAVMNIEALRANDFDAARNDAQQIAAASEGLAVGLIANAANLSDVQAFHAARIADELGASYVSGAGFGTHCSADEIRAIRIALGNRLQIVASGGCVTAGQASELLSAGADAIATSNALNIFQELQVS